MNKKIKKIFSCVVGSFFVGIFFVNSIFSTTGQSIDSWVWVASHPATATYSDGQDILGVSYEGKNYIYTSTGNSNRIYRFVVDESSPAGGKWEHHSWGLNKTGKGAYLVWPKSGNNIYHIVGGGSDQMEMLDLSGTVWVSTTPLPHPQVFDCAAVGTTDYIFLLTTATTNGGTIAFYRYNITTCQWEEMTRRPGISGIIGSTNTICWDGADKIYSGVRGRTDFRYYSISQNQWFASTPTPVNLGAGGASLISPNPDYVFLLVGGNSASFYKFTVSLGVWEQVASLPASIGGTNYGYRLALHGDYIYCWKGVSDGQRQWFWRYRWRDVDSPGKVTSFVAQTGSLGGTIGLSWVCPGNDKVNETTNIGALPSGSTFYIQYASWTGVNFSTTTQPPVGGYHLFIPTGPVAQGQTVSYTISNLIGGVTYYFRIWARDNAGNWSEISDGATTWARRIFSPIGFTKQSATPTSITWKWNAVTGADSYRIYQSTSPETLVAEVSSSQTSYTETNLSTNTAYGRFVRAYSTVIGESLDSDHATFYTLAVSPIGLEITGVFQSSVTLTWQLGDNPLGTRFGIAYAEDESFTINHTTFVGLTDNLVSLTTTVSGLGGNVTYYFRAWSYNGDGLESGYSEIVSTKTLPSPPSAPLGLFGVAISTVSIMWQWNITTNATYYQIYNSVDDLLIANLEGNGNTTYIEINLSSNTQYGRYVKAGNDQGLSVKSNTVNRYTLAYPPESLTTTAISSSTINLEWSYSGATKYEVWYSTFYTFVEEFWYKSGEVVSPNLSYSHTGLVAGGTYFYWIVPVNGDGIANYGFQFPLSLARTFPAVVTNFSTSALTTTSITWNWKETLGADGYKIYRATDNTVLASLSSGVTYFVEMNLSTNTVYGRYVRAFNTSGEGLASNGATFYTLAAEPVGLQVEEVTTNSVKFSWVANGNPNWTRYEVSYSTDNFVLHFATAVRLVDNWVETSTTVYGLKQNTTYYFRVRAFNGDSIGTGFVNVSTKTLKEILPIISQFATRGLNSAYDEFVEIYNPSPNIVNISNYKLQYWSGSAWDTKLTVPSGVFMGGYSFYLFASSSQYFTGIADLYHNTYLNASDDARGFRILDANNNVIDTVVYQGNGNVSNSEAEGGVTAPNHGTVANNRSVIRKVDANNIYIDTDNNYNDFIVRETRNPRNSQSPQQPDYKRPSAISNLTAMSGSQEGQVQLSWTSPSDNDGDVKTFVGNYVIKYSSIQIIKEADFDSPGFVHGVVVVSTHSVVPNTAVSYTLNLSPGTSYWFAIKSTDTAGNVSIWKSSGDVSNVNTLAYGWAFDAAPPIPTGLTATPSENSVLLSWASVGVSDLDYYELWCDSTTETLWDDSFIATTTKNTLFLHTGLENYVTYYYRVRAADLPPTVLYSDYSTEVSTYPRPTLPFAPSLNYDLTETTTWQIKWVLTDNSTNESSLHISSNADVSSRIWSSSALAGSGGTTSYIEAGFTPNQQVVRYAEAYNAVGSSWSAGTIVWTRANVPLNLSFYFVGISSVGIQWSNNSNPSYTRYEVSYSTDNFVTNFSTAVKLTDNWVETSTSVRNLVAGTSYRFRVRAFNNSDIPTSFVEISTTTNITGNLLKNEFFEDWVITSSHSAQYWSWGGSQGNLKRSDDALVGTYSAETSLTASEATLSQTGITLVSTKTYYAEVWVKGTGKAKVGIIRGGGGSANYGTQVTLNNDNWTKVTHNLVNNIEGNSGGIRIAVVRNTTTGEKLYIGAAWLSDTPPPSSWPPVVPPDTTSPSAISNLTALSGTFDGEVRLSWTSPGDDGDSGTLNNAVYRIKYSTTSFTSFSSADTYSVQFSTTGVVAGTNVSYTVGGLNPGTTYYFGIIARDDAGNWSVWNKDSVNNTLNFAAAQDLVPQPPVNLNASGKNRTIELSWSSPSPDPGDIDKYWIYQATFSFNSLSDGDIVHIATVSYPITSRNVIGLTNGVRYYYRIKSLDKGDQGNGLFSIVLEGSLSSEVSTVPRLLPASNLVAVHRGASVNLTWTHSADFDADNFSGYNIYRAESETGAYNFVGSVGKVNSFVDSSNVIASKTYYYIIRSSDTTGVESIDSNIATAIPDLVPPEFVLIEKLTTRSLGKSVARINLKVVDDRFEKNDRQGRIMSLSGKFRKTNDTLEQNIVFIPELISGTTEYLGEAEFDFSVLQIGTEGIEYYLVARDEVNISSWPVEGGWYRVELPAILPEQKFISVTNPEVVFGKEAEEVVIRDYSGNELWRGDSNGGTRVIIWRGEDKQNKKVESGAYIYEIKTKDGKKKYGVAIIVK